MLWTWILDLKMGIKYGNIKFSVLLQFHQKFAGLGTDFEYCFLFLFI